MSSTNRLAQEKSPYLIQHAHNPVEWFPWGDEAFDKAREEDKPVFLSIGYATCHWCHVMAHESFEDEQIAGLMNDAFVNIKVDREERPDIDNTYMTVCQMLTGSGGWPLTIIMTPEKKPFYAATYIPKSGRYGRPGMRELIPWIDGLWKEEREKIHNSADQITEAFQKSNRQESGEDLSQEVLDEAFRQYRENFDRQHGGFGSSPKFPSPHNLMLLLRRWKHSGDDEALGMVTRTLTAMRRGGLFDQVGLGFHRYSTDSQWLVPHFEKMLYDQAMLAMAYTEAWQATHMPLFRRTAEEILEYVLRDMQDEQGAFYSAEDADSEGEEGRFYVWSIDDIRNVLPGSQAELAIEVYNMTEAGNYRDEASGQQTGKNILHLRKPLEDLAEERNMNKEQLREVLYEIRRKLFEAREKRERPLLDDKILTDWNGLMIAALAKAAKAFENKQYMKEAERALSFLNKELDGDKGLLHRYRDGEAAIQAHADDYAFLIFGLIELYEAGFHIAHLRQAVKLNEVFIKQFWDDETGGFWFTSEGSEELLGRKKEIYDGALPSGNSIAALNLIRLGRMTGNSEWEEKAGDIFSLFSKQVEQAPTGFAQLLQAFGFAAGDSFEIVFAADRDNETFNEMLSRLNREFIPGKVTLLAEPGKDQLAELAPYTEAQKPVDGKPTVYVCQNYSCDLPVHSADEMMERLKSKRRNGS